MYKNIVIVIACSFLFNPYCFANEKIRYIKNAIPLKVRTNPEKNETIDSVIPGEKVEIVEAKIEENNFIYVKKTDGRIGWVGKKFFSKKSKKGYKLRSSPELKNDDSNKIDFVQPGEKLEYIYEKDGYSRVKTKTGKVGWILTKLLTVDQPKINKIKEDNKRLNSDLVLQITSLENLSKQHSELSDEYKELTAKYNNLAEEHKELTAKYNSLDKRYEELTAKYNSLGKKYEGRILISIIVIIGIPLIFYIMLRIVRYYKNNKKITTIR